MFKQPLHEDCLVFDNIFVACFNHISWHNHSTEIIANVFFMLTGFQNTNDLCYTILYRFTT